MIEQIKTDKVGFGELHNSDNKWFSDDTELISGYSRADAIADGVLVDLTAGFSIIKRLYKFPVACTTAVWAIISSTGNENLVGEVIAVVYASQKNIIKSLDETSHLFQVFLENAAPAERNTFKIVCHAGDNGEGVLTIMLKNED